jgi:hypothetical protein
VLRKATASIRVVARASIELPENIGERFGLDDAPASAWSGITLGLNEAVPASAQSRAARTIIS